jgi:hypothetical protein
MSPEEYEKEGRDFYKLAAEGQFLKLLDAMVSPRRLVIISKGPANLSPRILIGSLSVFRIPILSFTSIFGPP